MKRIKNSNTQKTKKWMALALIVILALTLISCGNTGSDAEDTRPMTEASASGIERAESSSDAALEQQTDVAAEETAETVTVEQTAESNEKEENAEDRQEDAAEETEETAQTTSQASVVQLNGSGKVVCIDAGHQAHQNTGTEPIGPGSSTMKQKVSSGTQGVSTGIPEYQLTLILAQKVQAILEAQGYTVIMCRTSNDVDLSNSERAQIANNAGANAFVRIHADGNSDSSVHGCSTLCQTSSNPYNASMYSSSRALASSVVNELSAATGARNRGVTETDSMSGINWAQVPVCIVEVGFMSNASEDQQMATEEYRDKIATGIANGIMKYLNQ